MDIVKTVEKGNNKKGTQYILALMSDGAYGVWKRCANYNGSVRGGIQYSLRYVQLRMDEASARALYTKRLAGAQ